MTRRWFVVLAAVAVVAIGIYARELREGTPVIDGLQTAQVVRVVDGDTIVVLIAGRQDRVRYIGIDAPESVRPNAPVECFGPEASDANRALVEGRRVYLEADVEDRDDFGRLLRYVFIDDASSGRIFVNETLVAGGYAESVAFRPNVTRQATLDAAEAAARAARRGMWGACPTGVNR